MGFGNNSLTLLINAKDNASNILKKVRKNVQDNAETYQRAGKKMMLASAAISAAIGVTIHTAAKFEKQMAQVSTMLDKNTMHYMPKFEKSIKSMAIEFGEGTQTLSRGLYDILSASIPPAKAMEVLEISVKAAKAGLTDAGVAADAITTILNSYSLSANQASSVSDLLFAIVKRGKITFAELAPNIGKVAKMAAQTGMSLEDLGATISTLTRNGIKTEMAMTAVRGTMLGMLKPGDEASKMFKDKVGLEMSSATLKAEGFVGVLKRMKKSGLTPEEITKMFPNARALIGVMSVIEDLKEVTGDYNLMVGRVGLAQEAFEKNTAITAHQLARLKQAFVILSVELGKNLLPAVSKLAKAIIGVIKYLNSFSDSTKKTIIYIAAFSAVLLGLSGVILTSLGSIGLLTTGMGTLTTAIASTTTGLFALKTLLLGGFTVGIAAGLFGIYKFVKGFYDANKAMKISGTIISKSVETQRIAVGELVKDFDKLKNKISELSPEQQKQMKMIQWNIDKHKELMETKQFSTEQEAASLRNILELYFDFQKMEWGIDEVSLVKKATITEAKKEVVYEYTEKEKEMMQNLSAALEAIDLTSYGKRKALIEKEFNDKKKVYNKESKNIKAMMAYEIKLQQIKHKQTEKLDKEELKRKSLMTNEIMNLTVGALIAVLEAEGSASKKRKGLYITLIAMEKALAIARLWTTSMGQPFGIARAIAGTAVIAAQFVSITKGMKETKIPEITSPEIAVHNENDFDSSNTSPYDSQGNMSNKVYGSASTTTSGVQKTEINLGGINLNFDVENLGELTPSDLDTLMRDFAEAVKAKTIEGLNLAKNIYNTGELLQEEAT